MPKQKNKKGIKSRFKITRSGKVLFSRSRRNHLLAKRSRKVKRQLRGYSTLKPPDARRVKKIISN